MSDVVQIVEPESEDNLICAVVLAAGELLPAIREVVPDPSYLYGSPHWAIYRAALSLYERQEPIFEASIKAEIRGNKTVFMLDSVGGLDWIDRIAERLDTAQAMGQALWYATRVRDAARKRFRIEELEAEKEAILRANGNLGAVIGDEAPPGLKTLSARDILTTDWPEPVWAVPGLLPAGLTFLAGKPKIGKSWLVLQLCLAVAAGGQFLGEKVEKGKVLYLALEDTPRRLKDRMSKQNWSADLACDFLTIGDFKKQIGDFRQGGSEVLAHSIQTEGYKLVAIDTFSRTVFTNQLEQHEMSAILEPLQTMAHKVNSALLITDHMAKNAGVSEDPVIDIYGSVAKGATLDTAWGLYRKRTDDQAKLVIDGRDIDGQKSLAIHFDGYLGSWIYDGDAFTVKTTQRRREIMGVIHNEGPVSNKELAELLEIPKSNSYEAVGFLISSGWVEKDPKTKQYTLTDEGRKIIGAKTT